MCPQEIVRKMSPHVIKPGHALRLRATRDLQTVGGERRATGEEWLVRDVGAYLPGVFEEVDTLTRCTHQTHSTILSLHRL